MYYMLIRKSKFVAFHLAFYRYNFLNVYTITNGIGMTDRNVMTLHTFKKMLEILPEYDFQRVHNL